MQPRPQQLPHEYDSVAGLRVAGRMSMTPSPARGSLAVHEKGVVIVPTYNERENITRIVPLILAQDERLDVLVVDDNSPDGTGDLADEMAVANPRVHVLHRAQKAGLGKAYLAGFDWALARDYEFVFEMDADFSHRLQSILHARVLHRAPVRMQQH